MALYPTTEELLARIERIKATAAPEEYAMAMAIGVYTDDVNPGEDPETVVEDSAGMVVIIFEGKIFHLSIGDVYLDVDPEHVSTILNAVILNAIMMWRIQYAELLAHAQNVLVQHGEIAGAEMLRQEIAESRD